MDSRCRLPWQRRTAPRRRLGEVLVDIAQAATEKPHAFLNYTEIAAQVKRGVPDWIAAEQVSAGGQLLAGEVRSFHVRSFFLALAVSAMRFSSSRSSVSSTIRLSVFFRLESNST